MDDVRTAAARHRSAAPDGPRTGTRRVVGDGDPAPLVLLVDDLQDAREMYAMRFAHAGFRVEHAVDGEHALLKVISLLPDVVVMDLAMPTLDGWEATHQMKTHPKTRHISVVVLTGNSSQQAVQRAEDAGADVVLTKPCSPDALLAVVQRVLRR